MDSTELRAQVKNDHCQVQTINPTRTLVVNRAHINERGDKAAQEQENHK